MKTKTELQQLEKRRNEIHATLSIQQYNRSELRKKLSRIEDRWFVSKMKIGTIKYEIEKVEEVILALHDYADLLTEMINKQIPK